MNSDKGKAERPFLNVDIPDLDDMTADQMAELLNQIANQVTRDDIKQQQAAQEKEVTRMKGVMRRAQRDGIFDDERDDGDDGEGGLNMDGSITLRNKDGTFNPILQAALEKDGEVPACYLDDGAEEDGAEEGEVKKDTKPAKPAAPSPTKKPEGKGDVTDVKATSDLSTSAKSSSSSTTTTKKSSKSSSEPTADPTAGPTSGPALGPTATQRAADPNNPKFDPLPDKTRVNRFTKNDVGGNVLQDVPPHVAGYVCDGSEIPLVNAAAHFRADLPDVFQDMMYRNWLLTTEYDMTKDKDLYDNSMKFALVSYMGPGAGNILCDNHHLRIWAFAKSAKHSQEIAKWVCQKTAYGRIFRIGLVPVGEWFTIPLLFDLTGPHPLFPIYMGNYINEQKRSTVELEQRTLDGTVLSRGKENTIEKQYQAMKSGVPLDLNEEAGEGEGREEGVAQEPEQGQEMGTEEVEIEEDEYKSDVPVGAKVAPEPKASAQGTTPSKGAAPKASPSSSSTTRPPVRKANGTLSYNPDLDRTKRYDDIKYYIFSCIGPKYGPPSERLKPPAEATYFGKIWGAAKKRGGCADIVKWINRQTEYGRLFHRGIGETGGWSTIPPTFSKMATATYSNPMHRLYMESLKEEEAKKRERMAETAL